MNMKLDTEQGHNLEEFLQSFAETYAWCSSRPRPWNALRSFRSPEIAPEFGCTTDKGWVSSVIWQRREVLGGKIGLPEYVFLRGKLLVYFPDENLDHGLEEYETEGFVTASNVPPWDTWVAYLYGETENYLVSWVPNEMVDLVNSGIEVSPEECFNWLGVRAGDLKIALESKGLELERNT